MPGKSAFSDVGTPRLEGFSVDIDKAVGRVELSRPNTSQKHVGGAGGVGTPTPPHAFRLGSAPRDRPVVWLLLLD